MTRFDKILSWRDHAIAGAAAVLTAHVISLAKSGGWLPQGVPTSSGLAGLALGASVCALVYALVLGVQYRRRLVAGPLYRCGESRPAADFGKAYEPRGERLFDHWQYH